MPDLEYYVDLLGDERRLGPFLRAIRRTVRRGDVFIDIGCGVGTYALEAKKAGATVHAVDMNRIAVALAREAGIDAKHGRAEKLRLPKADVVLFEDFGAFGHTPGLPEVMKVAGRLGRKFLPTRVELWLAPIEGAMMSVAPGLPFDEVGVAWLRKRWMNEPRRRRIDPKRLMAGGVRVGEIALDRPLVMEHAGRARCVRSGTVSALAGWMRVILPAGVVDNRPSRRYTSWYQAIFPFERPLRVKRGEVVEMRIGVTYGWGPLIWRWKAGNEEGCSLNARPGDLETLRRGSPDWVPAKADRVARIVKAMDGKRTAREIARAAGCSVNEVLDALGRILG